MPTAGKEKKYKRILLKLSGEELMGEEGFGIDPKVLDRMALEIGQLSGYRCTGRSGYRRR